MITAFRSVAVSALLASIFLAAAARAGAQGLAATLAVPSPSPYLSAWERDPTIAALLVSNSSQADVPVRVEARILSGQSEIGRAPSAITMIPAVPAVSVFRTPQIAQWSALSLSGGVGQLVRQTGRLPDGVYTLCVDLLPSSGGAALATSCSSFGVAVATPPRLIAPGDRVDVGLPQPVFQWLPAAGGATRPEYLFRLVELQPGQSPAQAWDANRPLVEASIAGTTVRYPLSALPLAAGRCYAWRVQVTSSKNGVSSRPAAAANEGRSEVWSFCYRPAAGAADTSRSIPANPISGTGGARSGMEMFGHRAGAGDDSVAVPTPRFSGSIALEGEGYDRAGAGPDARPAETGRMQLGGTLSFAGGAVTAPVDIYLSSDQAGSRQRISRFAVSPTWKEAAMHIGTFAPRWSELTLADAAILGGGVEARRGEGMRAQAWFGESRRATRPDPDSPGDLPEFARTLGAVQVGWGSPDKRFAEAMAMLTSDRERSLGALGDTTPLASPQRSIVVGARGQLPLARERLLLAAEVTHSQWRQDVRGDFPTVSDWAAEATAAWRAPTWAVGLTTTYVGSGYVSLGNSGLQSDRVDVQATGAYQTATLALNAQGGVRHNNLDDALAATTRVRGIYSVQLSWRPVEAFGLEASTSNVDNRSSAAADSLSSRTLVRSLAVAPRLSWQMGSLAHQLVLSALAQDALTDAAASLFPTDTRSRSLTASWSAMHASGMGVDVAALAGRDVLGDLRSTTSSVSPGVTLAAWSQRLTSRVGGEWSRVSAAGSREEVVSPVLRASWAMSAGESVTLDASRRRYSPRAESPDLGFRETRATFGYRRNF